VPPAGRTRASCLTVVSVPAIVYLGEPMAHTRFKVFVAHPETGREWVKVIRAATPQIAQLTAQAEGLLVSKVEPSPPTSYGAIALACGVTAALVGVASFSAGRLTAPVRKDNSFQLGMATGEVDALGPGNQSRLAISQSIIAAIEKELTGPFNWTNWKLENAVLLRMTEIPSDYDVGWNCTEQALQRAFNKSLVSNHNRHTLSHVVPSVWMRQQTVRIAQEAGIPVDDRVQDPMPPLK
jgi:hypothetical protein